MIVSHHAISWSDWSNSWTKHLSATNWGNTINIILLWLVDSTNEACIPTIRGHPLVCAVLHSWPNVSQWARHPGHPLSSGCPVVHKHQDNEMLISIMFFMTGAGMATPIGHFDFYPNGGQHMVGCPNELLFPFSASGNYLWCSIHIYSIYIFIQKGEREDLCLHWSQYTGTIHGKW